MEPKSNSPWRIQISNLDSNYNQSASHEEKQLMWAFLQIMSDLAAQEQQAEDLRLLEDLDAQVQGDSFPEIEALINKCYKGS